MKTYEVEVTQTTTYKKTYQVEAESKEKAEDELIGTYHKMFYKDSRGQLEIRMDIDSESDLSQMRHTYYSDDMEIDGPKEVKE